ncbi:MAG: aspartate aminotransferase family protein [Alphaproteobacteria bacterium]|nr:aspartate aminotransferase family protein [Alphaproteobacteria bacterium]
MQRGNSAASRDIAFHLHPYSNARQLERQGELLVTEGKGVRVKDEAGKEYLEGCAGLWCASLGFGEERLIEAAARQMRKLSFYHSFHHKSHDVVGELAERLVGMMPVKMSHAFFNNSGSEANDTAVKIVWYYNNARGRPRKKKIIARFKSYHGVTVASASLSGLPNNHRQFDLPIANIRHTDCPHHYRFAHAGESEEDFATRLAENLDLMIQREDPETVAAFIAEPVMGAGGVIVPPRTYYEKIQKVLKKHDVLFIADEVITGFGRTGKMFGTETFDLKPDIITVAKALSSAYLPISATVVSEPIYQALADESDKIGVFAHGYTYSGHPVCCAVALETLKIYEERDIIGHVQKVAPRLQNGLRQRFANHPLVGEIRGLGLVAGVELVADKATKAPFDPSQGAGNILTAEINKHGLILRQIGDAQAFAPPLVISEGEIDEMLDRFGKGLDDTMARLSPRQRASLRA